MEKVLIDLQEAIEHGRPQIALARAKEALHCGLPSEQIISKSINPAFKNLGQRMFNSEIYVTDVLMSSRAAHAAMYVLEPVLSSSSGMSKGVIAIGTVAGDLHDIGKKLIVMELQGNGYTVIDLGIDVTVDSFLEAVGKYKPDVLALSSLLTTTLPELKEIMESLTKMGLRSLVKVIVGGVSVTREYAAKIKADAYADDLFEACEAVDDLVHNRIGKYSVL